MNAKQLYFAGRVAVLALACMTTLCFTACSADDSGNGGGGNDSANTIIGTWVSETGKTPIWTYSFRMDGTGRFESTNGATATFKYTTSGGYEAPSGSIYFQFVNYYEGYVSRSESSGSYRVFSRDSLRLSTDGINKHIYIRKKD